MRILICCHEYYPKGSGIANLVYHLGNSMKKLGHGVDICSPIGPDIKIGSYKLIKKLGGLGIVYFWYKLGKRLGNLQKKYDKVYLHNPLLFKKIKSNKIYCVVHTLYYHIFKAFMWRNFKLWPYYFLMMFFERLGYYSLKDFKFIVTSPKTIKELKIYNVSGKIPIVFNGVNLDEKPVKNYFKFFKDDKKKLLFVGRLDIQKNLINLLMTYNVLQNLNNKYQLVIVGDGNEKNKLLRSIKRNKIKDVYLSGNVKHQLLNSIYRSCDYFILPSRYEGFPLTLAEALGNGLIPILSPLEIFKHIQGKVGSGLVVDFNKPGAARKINDYCSSINLKNEANQIGNKAKKLFGWDKIAEDYLI